MPVPLLPCCTHQWILLLVDPYYVWASLPPYDSSPNFSSSMVCKLPFSLLDTASHTSYLKVLLALPPFSFESLTFSPWLKFVLFGGSSCKQAFRRSFSSSTLNVNSPCSSLIMAWPVAKNGLLRIRAIYPSSSMSSTMKSPGNVSFPNFTKTPSKTPCGCWQLAFLYLN